MEELFRAVVVDGSFWETDEENGAKILRIQLGKVTLFPRVLLSVNQLSAISAGS